MTALFDEDAEMTSSPPPPSEPSSLSTPTPCPPGGFPDYESWTAEKFQRFPGFPIFRARWVVRVIRASHSWESFVRIIRAKRFGVVKTNGRNVTSSRSGVAYWQRRIRHFARPSSARQILCLQDDTCVILHSIDLNVHGGPNVEDICTSSLLLSPLPLSLVTIFAI